MKIVRTRNPWRAAASLAVAVLSLGALGALDASNAAAVALTGAGATFPYPIYSKWFDAYNQKTGTQINYQSIGSGGGIQQVKAGTVDFGASDAPLSNAQLKDLPRKIIQFPTVAGAEALAYNLPGFSGQLKLTPDLLAAIYMGKITTWNDRRLQAVNPGVALPAAPILPVHRSDGSGTTFIFTTYLSAVSGEWKELAGAATSVSWPAGIGGKGNEGVAGLVRQTPGAIGYVELAYAKQNSLPMALLRNKAGHFVEPTLEATTAAATGALAGLAKDVRTPIVNSAAPDAYPIAGFTFLLIYQDQKDAAKGKAIADFLAWAMTDGQSMVANLDYARLPESVAKVNQANLKLLTSAGKPVAATP